MTTSAFSYAVRIAFADRMAMEGFLDWLRDRHIADVCAAGALSAELVRLDGEGAFAIEARYCFASRDAFAGYERDHAPRLRAEGLKEIDRLGVPAAGVTFTRTTGEIVVEFGTRLRGRRAAPRRP